MSISPSGGRLPRDCRPTCPFVEQCSGEDLSRCPMQVRFAMFVNVFYSLLIHAAVIVFLLNFSIYGGSISPKHYGYMRVLLAGPEGGRARHGLKTVSKVRTKGVWKGERSLMGEQGKHSAPVKEAVNRRSTLRHDSGHGGLPVPQEQTPSLQTDRQSEVGRDVHRQPAPQKEKERTEETYAGGQGMMPLLTPEAEEKTMSEAIVPDLYKVPQVATLPDQTAPNLLKKTEARAAESPPPEKAYTARPPAIQGIIRHDEGQPAPQKEQERTEETYAGGQGMLPLLKTKAEEKTVSDAIVPALYGAPQVATSPDQTAAGLVKKTEVHTAESPPSEKAYTPGPPAIKGSAKQASPPVSPVPPVSVAAKKDDVRAPKAVETGKARGDISVEEEIRAAVTRIGETTYGPSGETSEVTKKGDTPKPAVEEDRDKGTGKSPVVLTVPPPALLSLKADSLQGGTSVEEEIRTAVTRIGETTYGPSGETSEVTKKEDTPKPAVEEDTDKGTGRSPAVLTVPPLLLPSLKPDTSPGEMWTDGTGREVRALSPSLSMNAQIHGGEIPSEEDAGKADSGGGVPFDWLKTDRADTARAFPMPEAFFIRDIRVNVSLKAPEMPQVSVKLLNRPLESATGGIDEKNHEVKVDDESVNIIVGGRVSTEEMFSVAKARKGVYTFVMENRGKLPCDADLTFVLYGGGEGGRIKAYEGLKILPGSSLIFRFVLPQAVFWDDADRFTGSIENSDSITKFDYDTGLVWKEEKGY